MPRVVISAEERRELEQELGRLEAERQTLTHQLHQARGQALRPSEDLELHAARDNLTLVEGRIQQLQAVLAAATPLEAGGGREHALGSQDTIRQPDGEEATPYRATGVSVTERKQLEALQHAVTVLLGLAETVLQERLNARETPEAVSVLSDARILRQQLAGVEDARVRLLEQSS